MWKVLCLVILVNTFFLVSNREIGDSSSSTKDGIISDNGEDNVGNKKDPSQNVSKNSGEGNSEADGEEDDIDDDAKDGINDGEDDSKADGEEDGIDDGEDDSEADGEEDDIDDGEDDGGDDIEADGEEDGIDDDEDDGGDDSEADGEEDGIEDVEDDSEADGEEDDIDDDGKDGINDGEDDGEDDSEADGCRGDRNATTGCDEECKMRCPGENTSSCKCPKTDNCKCKTEYLYDPKTFKCVNLKDCTQPNDDVEACEDEGNLCSCIDDNDEDTTCENGGDNITTTNMPMTTDDDDDTTTTHNPTTSSTSKGDDDNITTTNMPIPTDDDDNYKTTTTEAITTTEVAVLEECPEAINRFKLRVTSFHLKFISMSISKVPQKSFAGSPLATLFLIGVLYIFATVGAVFNELSNTLGLLNKNEAYCVFRTINNEAYNLPTGIDFAPATDILANSEYLFTDSIKKIMEEVIVGKALNYDSKQPDSSLNEVNILVEKQTKGKISNLITSPDLFSQSSQIGFASALYFLSKWEIEFKPKMEKGLFYIAPFKFSHTYFMVQQGMYNYTESNILNSQIIDIPYFQNKFSLLVILPKFSSSIGEVIKKCNPEVLDSVYKSLRPSRVHVQIPPFNITTLVNTVADIKATNSGPQLFNETAAKYDGAFVENKQPIVSFGRQKNILLSTTEGGPLLNADKPHNIFEKHYSFNANKAYIFIIRLTKLEMPVFSGVMADPGSTSVEL